MGEVPVAEEAVQEEGVQVAGMVHAQRRCGGGCTSGGAFHEQLATFTAGFSVDFI